MIPEVGEVFASCKYENLWFSLWQGLRNISVSYRVIDSLLTNCDPHCNEFMAKKSPSNKRRCPNPWEKKKKKENMPSNLLKPVPELSKLEHKNWAGSNVSKWGVWGNSKDLGKWMLQGRAELCCHIHPCPHCLQGFVFPRFADDNQKVYSQYRF